MRVLIEKRYVDTATCGISDPTVEEITACLLSCADCFAPNANRGVSGVWTFSAPGSYLLNGITGIWSFVSNLFPGSINPEPGIIFLVAPFTLGETGVTGAHRTITTVPSVCGIIDPAMIGRILVIKIWGTLVCRQTGPVEYRIFGSLGFTFGLVNPFGFPDFLCLGPAVDTDFTLNCPTPFNISFTFNLDDMNYPTLGTGILTVTFLQTFP